MDSNKLRLALQLLGIGWYVAICIGGGAFGGLWLDRQTNLGPIFTLVGLGLGIAVAIIGMFRMLMAVIRATPDATDNEGGG